MTVSIAPPSRPSQAETRRAIWNTIRGSSGNLVEWYDVYVYTVFATYFEDQFFDRADRNSTVYVYAIFAVTFVTRPVGSWFLGRFADRRGRRAALTFSVSLMAACSLIVALVPSRSSIGVAAPPTTTRIGRGLRIRMAWWPTCAAAVIAGIGTGIRSSSVVSRRFLP
ncbi:MFS transporter [Mycobacterium tuberculosis]|uniref:MFS transporter n=1 Tax=Mycobacterium tuberculosis TaxID=1773 RepID=UPI001F3BBCA5|nr:MFS transporter [Mycobacterium tuberculosis]